MNNEERQRLHSLLSGIKTFMMVTESNEGKLEARPMAVISMDEDFNIIFFTSSDTTVSYELALDHSVLLTYQDGSKFLSLNGRATVSENRRRARELWSEAHRVWFPDGPEDRKLKIISFSLQEAEYWDNQGLNKVRYVYEAVKAYAAGETPDVSKPPLHGRIAPH